MVHTRRCHVSGSPLVCQISAVYISTTAVIAFPPLSRLRNKLVLLNKKTIRLGGVANVEFQVRGKTSVTRRQASIIHIIFDLIT
jgi:hypothetical protein